MNKESIDIVKSMVSPKIDGYVNECLLSLVSKIGPQKVMEIGTLNMNTAAKLCELGCEVHSFDIDKGQPFGWPEDFNIDRIEKYSKLRKKYPKLFFHSNTNTVYDTYNWTMINMLNEYKSYFDVVFSDGAHVYLHDALAFFLSDIMLMKGGLMIFDDYNWKLGHDKFKEITNHYTKEQLNAAHVKLIIENIVSKNKRYKRIGRESFIKIED